MRRGKKIRIILLISTLCLMASSVFAAETGIISGKIVDGNGDPLPGVLVTVEGRKLQGTRTTETNEDGVFRFPLLPVGSYKLTCELMGFAPLQSTNIPVRLGMTTPIEVEMKETAVKDVIVVEASAPLVEKESADLSVRISSEDLSVIPSSSRSFRDLTKFVPGVTGVRIDTVDGTVDGYPSIRGEGQYGNNYLIDGLSVRDPAVKSTGTPLNYDAIEEIQIITDGFSPEYGRSLGGTVNVVTKSGGNDFSGELAMLYESDLLAGEEKDSKWAVNRDYTDLRPYFNIGGPVVKDRLWFFVSYNRFDVTDKYEDMEPAEGVTIEGANKKEEKNNVFGKLTLGINPNNTLSFSGTFDETTEDQVGIDESRREEARGEIEYDQKRFRLNYKSIVTSSTILEAKYGFIDREISDVPMSGDLSAAQYRDVSTTEKWNNYDNEDILTRGRNDFLVEVTQYLDDMYGDHEIKGGLSYHATESTRDLHFTGSDSDLFPERMAGGSEFVYDGGVPYIYYDYSGAKVENETKGFGFYIRDKWSPLEYLNVMAGFRFDNQEVLNNEGDELFSFGIGDTLAPRLTAAWDVTRDGQNVVKVGAGRFYDVVSTSLAEWGNTSNPYSFDRYQYGGPGNPYTGGTFTPGDEMDPNNWGTWEDTDDDGEPDTFNPGEPSWTQDPTADPILYDDDLKPYYKDEILVEFDRIFMRKYAAKARYVQGWTRDLIEDVAYNIDDWYVINFDRKKRDYKAVELELLGRPTENVNFQLAYVWSEAKGTTPGQFERGGYQSSWGSGNNVGVFGDRPPYDPDGTEYDEDAEFWAELLGGLGGLDGDDGWYGHLPYSVDHQIMLNSSYRTQFGLVVGLGVEWNSGYHWQKRGFQEAYGGYLTFPEERGSREMPSIYWIDLSLAYNFRVYRDQTIGAKIDVFNITDNDTPVSYIQEDTDSFGEVLKRQSPRSARLTLTYSF